MNEPVAKTLLALWLTEQDTEVHLSPEEKSAINELCRQLSEHPETRDLIGKDLTTVVEKNQTFHQAFQNIRNRLEQKNLEELLELLPTTKSEQGNHITKSIFTDNGISRTLSLSRLEQLLVQLRTEILAQKLEEDEDEKLAIACALVDELGLGWEEEWEQSAITDWEASGL